MLSCISSGRDSTQKIFSIIESNFLKRYLAQTVNHWSVALLSIWLARALIETTPRIRWLASTGSHFLLREIVNLPKLACAVKYQINGFISNRSRTAGYYWHRKDFWPPGHSQTAAYSNLCIFYTQVYRVISAKNGSIRFFVLSERIVTLPHNFTLWIFIKGRILAQADLQVTPQRNLSLPCQSVR